MAPPVESWSATELPDRVQVTAEGRRRKDQIELSRCELMQMVQYECFVADGGRRPGAPVVCRPIERLFRR
jgi:Mitochondrial export protein Som1